jgi:hypothetical protein
MIFAAFASIGRTELVFTCNAVSIKSLHISTLSRSFKLTSRSKAVALVGFGVLLFSRFPLEGSRRLDKEDMSVSTD